MPAWLDGLAVLLIGVFIYGFVELYRTPVDRSKWCIACQEGNHYFCKGDVIMCDCACRAAHEKVKECDHDHA
jgi:hypothetical protein